MYVYKSECVHGHRVREREAKSVLKNMLEVWRISAVTPEIQS